MFFTQCTPKVGETVKKDIPAKTDVLVVDKPITFRSNAPTPGPAPRIQMGKAEQFRLDNGLQVIVVENRKLPRVSYQLFVDAPAIHERSTAGAIELAGEMLNKGTSTKMKSEIDESIDFIGATLRTSASGMYGASLKRHNTALLEVMSDVLLNPSFPQKEFDKLVKQYNSSLVQAKDDPSALSNNISNQVVYGKDHPYGESMTEETLAKITIADAKAYYKDYFKPNISYLIVVGDISVAEAKPMAEKYFGKWEASSNVINKSYKTPVPPSGTTVDFVNKSGAVQSVINITYPVDLKPGAPDVIKSSVMNTWLGGRVYFGNRLNQNLRETNAYTYGARSRLSSDKEVGSFAAGASVRNEVTDSSVVEFMNEFKYLRNTKIDTAELQKVKNVLSGSFGRSLESPETIARFALNIARYKLPADYYASYLEKLQAVTADDVMAMAKKYVRPDNAHIVVVGNKDEVADKLIPFAKSGKINFYDYKGNLLKMDDDVVPAGVTAKTVIEDYINAIGGRKKLSAVKSIQAEMSTEMQGMALKLELFQSTPDKYAMFVSMGGNVMQGEVLNGNKGMVSGMGNSKKVEGAELETMKAKAVAFPELTYVEDGYKMELKGMETVEGVKAYKVELTSSNGAKETHFYDVKTSLKIQAIETQELEGQKMVTNRAISNYKDIDGILFPHTMTVTNSAMPMPMKMETKSIKVNGDIDESVFRVE